MAIKTFGKIGYIEEKDKWELAEVKPHVCIKLKAIFPRIPKTQAAPFSVENRPEDCHDLLWFMDRYPLEISHTDLDRLMDGRNLQKKTVAELEYIFSGDYEPIGVALKDGFTPRDYQLRAADFDRKQKRWLLGDDLGLGKTLEAILTLMNPDKLPSLVVVQAHLPNQWEKEGVKKFTHLRTHIMKGTKPYELPEADVYITTYSRLAGWVDYLTTGWLRSVIFDEVQELRICVSQKSYAARRISEAVEYCLGMSATPIYNYGDEIFNILDLIKPGCLGDRTDFLPEWASHAGSHWIVRDPIAVGSYLRDNYLFLRRTRKDVGRELPPVNKIVFTIDYDESAARKADDIAHALAIRVTSGSFVDRGQAARELDVYLRHMTGVAKAHDVALFVRLLLESGEPIVLAGWHREVYEEWARELAEFKPVFYTGEETAREKELAKEAFIRGDTNLFIISLRSGIGLDGLQQRCRTVVFGELDWSPQVHNQVVGRVDREGQEDQVTAYFPVCDFGSDPVIIDMLGLKASQAHGIVNPFEAVPQQFSDESRIKILAQRYLDKK